MEIKLSIINIIITSGPRNSQRNVRTTLTISVQINQFKRIILILKYSGKS